MFTTGGAQEHFFKKYVHIFVRLHSFSKNVLLGATSGEHSIGSTLSLIYILLPSKFDGRVLNVIHVIQ